MSDLLSLLDSSTKETMAVVFKNSKVALDVPQTSNQSPEPKLVLAANMNK
jgi:hypothetical protein